jgi:DNA ligase-1
MATKFKELAQLAHDLEATPKTKEKIGLISEFLKGLDKDEISPAVLLITGNIFPESDSRTLDAGWKTLKKAMQGRGQTSLLMKALTIKKVHGILSQIASTEGEGSRKIKMRLLEGLITQTDEAEREILFRIILGEMRIGVSEGVMLEGIAEAIHAPLKTLRRALMFTGDLGEVAEIALKLGLEGLKEVSPRLFTPLKPMLATMAEDIQETITVHGGRTSFEYKFDGARIQAHRGDKDIRIFSRRLSDVTESLPDLVEIIYDIPSRDLILDGEVTAIGETGRPLPFQDLMRRFTRVNEIDESIDKIPLRLHLFDILYLDGRLLIDEPYIKRMEILEKLVPEEYLVKKIITGDQREAELFLEDSIKAGNEGLIAKRLESKYNPGNRGKLWFKIKPVETLDVVVKAADWGSGRRREWLSNYHLAVRDKDEYLVVGKTFKGLTDEEFEWVTEKLMGLKVSDDGYTVRVKPSLVFEVAFNEIQRSPHYRSGYALRFARVKRIREDKSPQEIDTLERLNELYEEQFRYKDKLSKKIK